MLGLVRRHRTPQVVDDVEKLDSVEDDFVHYQYQATLLHFLNFHILGIYQCYVGGNLEELLLPFGSSGEQSQSRL